MSELFLKVLNMSISAGWLVLAVLLLRLILKKAPRWINVVLWGIVALRLAVPFSIESALSLIPSAETIPLDIAMEKTPTLHTGIDAINRAVNPMIRQAYTPNVGASVNPLQVIIPILAIIWIVGIVVLLVYTVISYLRLQKKVSTAIPFRERIYQSEHVNSPFVLGIIKPRIYLPFDMSEQDLPHVIAHEQAHIRRKDHWWKPLGFLLLTIHWFNPLVWLSYVLLCRDIELACDERVIRELGNEKRADYTQALLSCSVNRRTIAACPLAFGEISVKERVKSVMNYKKPAFWIVIAAIIVCAGVAVGFLTNPVRDKAEIESQSQTEEYVSTNLSDVADNTEPVNPDEGKNALIDETSYYLELASGKEFQEMDAEQSAAILKEYEALFDEYTFLARESTDKTAAYVLGYYNGADGNSPFHSLHTMEFSLPMEDTWQLLYRESDAEAVNQSLGNGEIPDVGYVIKDSHIQYTSDGELIMIQPANVQSNLVSAFTKCLTPKGRAYIADAASRGIALSVPEGAYITVYLISEKYGEISEMIPVSNEEAQAIRAEELQMLDSGLGFAAGLCIDGEAVYYTEKSGVPQSVLTLAQEKCGYKFASPKDITAPVVEAKLECDWLDAPLYADENDLERLEDILLHAEYEGMSGCGYGAKLTVKLSDGSEVVGFKGCDGCDSMAFGSYGGYAVGDSENTEFWEIFGLDVETKEPLLSE